MIFLIYFFITLKYNVYCLLRHLIGLFIVIPDKDIRNFLPHSQYEKIRGVTMETDKSRLYPAAIFHPTTRFVYNNVCATRIYRCTKVPIGGEGFTFQPSTY